MWRKLTDIRRVLVPVDLSDDSLCAVEAALTFTRDRRTQIYLIHVMSHHDGGAAPPHGEETAPGNGDRGAQEERDGRSRTMEEFFLRKVRHQSNIACIVRSGTPAREILRFAREENIDLIVLPLASAASGGHAGAGGVADIVINNSAVPVVVVKPESAVRRIMHTEDNVMMKYDEKYLQEIRQRVCSKCIDRTASGLCTASTFEACAINRYLPEIIDIVLSGPPAEYDEYVSRLRSKVCSACGRQSPDGRCDLRDDVECALDRYFPVIIEAIRDAAAAGNKGAGL